MALEESRFELVLMDDDGTKGKADSSYNSSIVMSLIVSYLCCPLSHEMSWMRSGTESSQFLRIFLPTLINYQ